MEQGKKLWGNCQKWQYPEGLVQATNCCQVADLLFTGLATTFLKNFAFDLWVTFPLLLSLAVGVIVLGQIVGKKKAGHHSMASTGRSSQEPNNHPHWSMANPPSSHRSEPKDNPGGEPKAILGPTSELRHQVVCLNQPPMNPVDHLGIDAASQRQSEG